MALLHCTFFSQSIQKMTALDAIVPEGKGRGPFPVLYLLHGLSDDQTVWQRRTSIERYVEGLPLIVVMPDGYRSFYINAPAGSAGVAGEDLIVKDVVGFVENTFPALRRREGRAVVGLSMGGYGAFMLALKHPSMFAAASSHSGALYFAHWESPQSRNDWTHLLGERVAGGGPYDLLLLSAKAAKAKPGPALRFDCGRKDFLIQHNRAFRRHLQAIRYPHVYHEYPGAHTWDYWDVHVRESIAFVMKHLRKA